MTSFSRKLLLIPAALIVAVIGVIAYKLWPVLNPTIVATAVSTSGCDLHQSPCTMQFDDGQQVTLSISPKPLKVMEPLTLEVKTTYPTPWSVEVDLIGVSMNMGFNRPVLKEGGEGHYTGEAMLPTCIRQHMDWEAHVLIRTTEGYHAAPYRFTTVRQ